MKVIGLKYYGITIYVMNLAIETVAKWNQLLQLSQYFYNKEETPTKFQISL